MESETIDISSENDVSVVTKAATISIKRRSSIFRPNEEGLLVLYIRNLQTLDREGLLYNHDQF